MPFEKLDAGPGIKGIPAFFGINRVNDHSIYPEARRTVIPMGEGMWHYPEHRYLVTQTNQGGQKIAPCADTE